MGDDTMMRKKTIIITMVLLLIVLTGCKENVPDDNNLNDNVVEALDPNDNSLKDNVVEAYVTKKDLTSAQANFIGTHSVIEETHITENAMYFHYKEGFASYITKISDEILWTSERYYGLASRGSITFVGDSVYVDYSNGPSTGTKNHVRIKDDGTEDIVVECYLNDIHTSLDGNTLLYIKQDPNNESKLQVINQTNNKPEVIYNFNTSEMSRWYDGIFSNYDNLLYIVLLDSNGLKKYVVFEDFEMIQEFTLTPEDMYVHISDEGFIFYKNDNTIEITDFNQNVLKILKNTNLDLSSYNYSQSLALNDIMIFTSINHETETTKYIKVDLKGNVDYDFSYTPILDISTIATLNNESTLVLEKDNTNGIKNVVLKSEKGEILWRITTTDRLNGFQVVVWSFDAFNDLILYNEWFVINTGEKLETYNYDGELINQKETICKSLKNHLDENFVCITDEGKIVLYDKEFTETVIKEDKVYSGPFFITHDGHILVHSNLENSVNDETNQNYSVYYIMSTTGEIIQSIDVYGVITKVLSINNKTYVVQYRLNSGDTNPYIAFGYDGNYHIETDYTVLFSYPITGDYSLSIAVDDKLITYTRPR